MPIPKRPISVVDIANELDVELPLSLRDDMVIDLAGVSGVVSMLDLEERSSGGPLTLRLQDGRVVTPTALGTIPGSNVELSMPSTQLLVQGSDLVEVVEWAKLPHYAPTITGYQFYRCVNLTTVPTTIPEWITIMNSMFRDCTAFNQNISGWDVSKVTSMNYMFRGCSSFNQNISGWDVSKVTSMAYMFYGCSSFNQNISGWCVSKISTQPSNFDNGASSWTLPRPVWGTCPSRP